MFRRISILFIFLFLFSNVGKAGKKTLDSLFNELDNMVEDSVKIKLYNDLSWENGTIDPIKSLEYANKAYMLTLKNESKEGQAEAFSNMGSAFYFLSYYDTALFFYEKSLKIKQEIKDEQGASATLSNIATIYDIKGEYDSAVVKFSIALALKEKIGDTTGMVNVLSNIGLMYMMLGEHETALSYFHKCLFLEKYSEPNALGNIYNNLGYIYSDYADTSEGMERNEYFNISMNYHKKALEIRKELDDYQGQSHSYTNIANLYAYIGEYELAMEKYLESIEIQKEIKDLYGWAHNLNNLSRLYYNTHNYQKAIEYAEKCQKISLGIGSFDLVKDNYNLLSTIYKEYGMYNKSLVFYKKYTQIKDSLVNLEVLKQLNELKLAYKTKETELELLKKEEELKSTLLSKNKIFNLGLIFLVVISVIFAFFLHAALKKNKKANNLLKNQNREILHQKDQISEQNEEIENKNTILNETYQLLAIKNKDITDSLKYARNIQRAILPDDQVVEKLLPKSFVLFLPKDYVSGDFYWVDENWGKIYFAAADCTGHGVPGAFMSIVGYSLLNKAINENYLFKPADILAFISKGFQDTIRKHNNEYFLKAGMDIALCCYDPQKMMLEYSGAFNSLYIIRQGELIKYKADLYPIGRSLEPKENYTNHHIELQKNDMIYIFSDGFTDQFGGPHDRKFMTKQMKDTFLRIHELSPEKQRDELEETFYKWKKGNDQIDDVLVFGVRV